RRRGRDATREADRGVLGRAVLPPPGDRGAGPRRGRQRPRRGRGDRSDRIARRRFRCRRAVASGGATVGSAIVRRHRGSCYRVRPGARMTPSDALHASGSSVVINPATEEVLRTVEPVDVAAVDEAITKAARAQRLWARLPPAERAAGLRAFAAVVDQHIAELAALEVANSGHPISSAEWEAGHVRDVLQYYAASPERLSGKQIPVADGLNVTFHEPLGVFGVITPWNFP